MDYLYITLFGFVFILLHLQERKNAKLRDEIKSHDKHISQALKSSNNSLAEMLSLSKRFANHLETDNLIVQKVNSLSHSVDILQNKEIDSLIDEQEGLMKQGEKK